MFRLPTYLLGILLIFVCTNYAQVDPGLCPEGATSPVPDPKWRTIPPRFEIMTELISDKSITELSQAFSTTRDSIFWNANGGPYQFYYNFATDEVFDVLIKPGANSMPFCLRQALTPASETSVLQPKTLFVKPSVLLGFNQRNQRNPDWGVRYQGDGELRRIPTMKFQSCFYLNDIRATVRVDFQVTNPDRFQPGLTPRNESLILQMDVKVKNQTTQENFLYNVFRYISEPSRREERQALETPTGIYCPNRISTMPIPSDIPERVSANSELFVPNGNSSAIFSSHSLYDTEFQFVRFDAWFPDPMGSPFWLHFTEIHDFAVGLTFRYDNRRHQCVVGNITTGLNDAVAIDDNPSFIQMGSPQHLFLMDDITYQYTGEKPCHDRIWCHVWIGEKALPNAAVQHREWYWSSSINGEPTTRSKPMKLVLKQYNNGVPNGTYEMNFFNYRRQPMTIFEIDFTLAECYRALGPAENYNLAVLTFKIINDKKYPVYQNLNYLRFHIWETLVFTMFARPTRISHLIVDQDDGESNDIIVTFTLLDVPPVTGPVEDPIQESSLDRLITRLSNIIDSNGLAFRARYGSKQVTLRARGGSLNVPHTSTKTISKTSGPKITGLWLGLILVGLVVGGVAGFFVLEKLANK
ncbi:unnamed protein product [Adineta ricciae]|uniref:Uncharacterized protein n=1 Tax=Adineta ricciae TaxID=249248 RepID=A0A813WGQ9_ADIRI|nr:unnamed protein product [Adineta ricciae]CAF1107373.1 unnamed protein product [Adineta ricciae]